MNKIDLHIHSCYSPDGDESPEKLIDLACQKNLKALAITDHNTTKALPELLKAAKHKEIEIIPGIELDTHYKKEYLIHILGYFINWQSPKIEEFVSGINEKRLEQFYKRIEKLQKLGYKIEAEEVIKKSNNYYPLGVTIAEVLLSKPFNREKPELQNYFKDHIKNPNLEFYFDFFDPGGKAYVPSLNPETKSAIKLVRDLGGVPVLAHPGANLDYEKDEDIIDDLIDAGVKGIEAYSNHHTLKEISLYLKVADEKNLVPTAGSDYHGSIKPSIEIGEIKGNSYKIVEKLKSILNND